jgi:hypothetical protein
MIAKTLLFLAAVTWITAAPPGNSFMDANGNNLRLSSPFEGPPGNGLYPVLVEMTSLSRAARWSVNQNTFGYGTIHRNMIFECPPGESRRTMVLLASNGTGNRYMDGVNLEIITEGVRDSMRFDTGSRSGAFQNTLFGEKVLSAPGESSRPYHGYGALSFTTAIAPADWRAYAGYRGVVVTDAEWRAMEPGARVAIVHYAKSGGSLVVIVPDEAAASTLPGFPKPDDPNRPGRVGLGKALAILKADANDKSLSAAIHDGFSNQVSSAESASDQLIEWRRNAPEFFPQRSSTLTSLLMLVVLVAFAILIGPVNLFVIAPAKRRHRLFFSVPVIALSTSALLLVFVLLSDGLGGKGHRFLLIENRPGEGEAVNHVIQYQTSRCGVLFSTGFESGVSATIEELGDTSSGFRRSGSGETKELIAEPDNLEGNGAWFVSRTSQSYRVAATVPGRGRIEIRGSGPSAKLTSTFAFPLEALWFRDSEGKWWKSGPLKMGEPVGVLPVTATEPRTEWTAMLRKAPTEIINHATEAAQRRASFIAFTTAPEGVTTHSSIDWTDQAVITGPLFQP